MLGVLSWILLLRSSPSFNSSLAGARTVRMVSLASMCLVLYRWPVNFWGLIGRAHLAATSPASSRLAHHTQGNEGNHDGHPVLA